MPSGLSNQSTTIISCLNMLNVYLIYWSFVMANGQPFLQISYSCLQAILSKHRAHLLVSAQKSLILKNLSHRSSGTTESNLAVFDCKRFYFWFNGSNRRLSACGALKFRMFGDASVCASSFFFSWLSAGLLFRYVFSPSIPMFSSEIATSCICKCLETCKLISFMNYFQVNQFGIATQYGRPIDV